jgi:DNA-binding transcriptional MerR regulator
MVPRSHVLMCKEEPQMEQTPTPKMLRSTGVQAATGATRGELRSWESWGFIAPSKEQHVSQEYRIYDETMVNRIRQIRFLKAKGLTPRGVERALPELQAWELRTGKQMRAEDRNSPAGDNVATNSADASGPSG